MTHYRLPPHWLNSGVKLLMISIILASTSLLNFTPSTTDLLTPEPEISWEGIPENELIFVTDMNDMKINHMISRALLSIKQAQMTQYSVTDESAADSALFTSANPNQSIKK